MPKDTYYNLSDEKRLRIFNAAVDELIRVPFSEISINQIIQNAGISRGSFYQYFVDKHDLIQYVLADYVAQFIETVRIHLRNAEGNVFDGFVSLFRAMIEIAQDKAVRRALGNLISEAGGKGCSYDYAMSIQREIISLLVKEADRSRLLLEDEVSVYRMIRVLFVIMKEAAGECLHDFQRAEIVFNEFVETLNILREKVERR
ncbi:TetR/AcrR family transcriptional regulator [Ihubacter sp. rT4E-8]|uniref:TetR/AcrR family transcriptional regulator n=1 Tax=Ihubacter sp. rT4E-8 TaxID=3242369 RepID=UPI003CF34C7E